MQLHRYLGDKRLDHKMKYKHTGLDPYNSEACHISHYYAANFVMALEIWIEINAFVNLQSEPKYGELIKIKKLKNGT